MAIRLVIVDDQDMIRAGLRMLLEAEPDIEVVGEAQDGLSAVDRVLRLQPDVVLMDIRMPQVDGLEATRRILAHDAEARIVVLTTFDDDGHLYDAMRAGASGFLLKTAPADQLVLAVRTAAAGDGLIDPAVTRRVIGAFASRGTPAPSAALEQLTDREAEVLAHLARGRTNREIAEAFVVSEATVKTHVARVLMKLDLRDRVQAVVFAYEHGVVVPGDDDA